MAISAAACGGGNGPGPQPTPQPPVVTSIAPAAGSVAGGTAVTIHGANFAAGAVVTIGGAAATAVAVQSPTVLTAVTAPRSAGPADVVVIVGGLRGTLAGGYTYAVPGPASNPAPTVSAITTKSAQPRAPAGYAEAGEDLAVSVTVADDETPPEGLVYEWSADGGTFSGTGASVTWQAPAPTETPVRHTLSLVVVERWVAPDGQVRENRVGRSVQVNVHDSVRELGDMAILFLEEFSDSSIDPETVVRNFSTSCRGRQFELQDVEYNRQCYVIDDYTIGPPTVKIQFDSTCTTFPGRPKPNTDGCVTADVRWVSTSLGGPGCEGARSGVAEGVDHVTGVYEGGRWYLCDSDFQPAPTTTLLRFKR